MAEHELSLEESDRRRREAITEAERAVLEAVDQTHPVSARELRVALDALSVDQAVLRTAVLRLLSEGRLVLQRQTTAAAR